MSNPEDTKRIALEQVRACRAWINPIEHVAKQRFINFDTVIKPATATRAETTIDLQATVKATLELDADFQQGDIAENYAVMLEHYAQKMTELAKTLRAQFPRI